jgi:HEAT repeats
MKILVISLISLVLAAAADPPAKSPPRSKPLVEFQNGRMSVKATKVLLKDLLSEMEKKSGIAVELKDIKAAERPLSIDLKSVLPTRAFQEVLRDLNYAFLYSENRLSQVLILPPGVEISQRQVEKGPQPTKRFDGRFDRAEKGPLKAEREQKALKQKTIDSRVQSKLAAIAELEDSDDPKSIVALGDMLADPSPEVKEAALSALTDKEGSLATQMIRRGLNDRTPEFRIEVLEALGERKDIESLRRGMADSNKDVRERAAELLEQSKP